jgi:uncharacterized protein DUF1329
MRRVKKRRKNMKSVKNLAALIIFVSILVPGVGFSEFTAPDWNTYKVDMFDMEKHKNQYDDPTPIRPLKDILPAEFYEYLTGDVDEMKALWEKAVGFKAPDVVGKIAPEIKPGKYTYKDLAQNPGFKELMPEWLYNRIAPGGEKTGHGGNIPEFEIVPTRQYYYNKRIAQATLDNMGKTKQDEDGYVITETLAGGLPFPRPSGPHKAQQIMYNIENRVVNYEFCTYMGARITGLNSKLKVDFDGWWDATGLGLSRRTLIPPYGYFDERAQKRKERKASLLHFGAPRDIADITQGGVYYMDSDRPDQLMLYIPAMRRVRKMTATDTQDPMVGMDIIYDDGEGWFQKLSKTSYPYKYEMIEEREYLVPAPTWDGSCYISKKENYAFKGLKFERRPIQVIKLTQLDPNYVYQSRILYVDKEHLAHYCILSYDQKGRLYREWSLNFGFEPNVGMLHWGGALVFMGDHLDTHCTIMQPFSNPAAFGRSDLSIQGIMKRTK